MCVYIYIYISKQGVLAPGFLCNRNAPKKEGGEAFGSDEIPRLRCRRPSGLLGHFGTFLHFLVVLGLGFRGLGLGSSVSLVNPLGF